jgi:hypothetical protein
MGGDPVKLGLLEPRRTRQTALSHPYILLDIVEYGIVLYHSIGGPRWQNS